MTKYLYTVHEVTEEEWKETPLGGEFRGGLVIEGTADADRDQLLLITRHDLEEDE